MTFPARCGEIPRAMDKDFRERALAPVSVPVRDAERVLRELRPPREDGRDEANRASRDGRR